MSDAAAVTLTDTLPPDTSTAPETAQVIAVGEGSEDVTSVVVVESKPEADPSVTPPAEPQPTLETPKVGETPKAEPTVENSGVDLQALAKEYTEAGGKISEETYADLAKKGLTKEIVDGYIDGQKAKADAYNNSLAESVGGSESLNKVLEWAAGNLTEAEKAAANKALGSWDADIAKLALGGLKARYEAAVGRDPKLVTEVASGQTAATVKPYESTAEMVRDMQNPLYAQDPAFRAKVHQRIAAG